MRTVTFTHAKARLSEIADAVEAGEEMIVLRHGKPVMRLSPASNDADDARVLAAVERLKNFPRVKLEPGETIKGFINEGRKY